MLQCVAIETLISPVAYIIFFSIHLAPGSNWTPIWMNHVQDMQLSTKLVANLSKTSLVISVYKYFVRKWRQHILWRQHDVNSEKKIW